MPEPPSGPPADYALGRSGAETRRLIVQHQLYGPFTRQFLTAAGVTAGMRSSTSAAAPGTWPCSWPSWSAPRAGWSGWT
jgi:hypothetical protein